MKFIGVTAAFALLATVPAEGASASYFKLIDTSSDSNRPHVEALFYKSAGIYLILESNRRIITAISKSGSVLWSEDPFEVGHLKPYRVAKPIIVEMEIFREHIALQRMIKKGHNYVLVKYDSSQEGLLDVSDGVFMFVMQN